MKPTLRLMAAAMALLFPLLLLGQMANENLANAILAARSKEAALLQQYNWNSRTEILQDGKMQDIRIDLVNCGPNGQPQRTVLNDQPGQLPGGFLRRAIEENQRKQLDKYIVELSRVLDQYTLPSAGKIIAFIVQAQVQPITTPDGKTMLQVQGTNVITPGDSFTLMLDGHTLQTTSIQITTTYNGDPVTISATFKAVPPGPNHLQFATVDVPAKKLSLMIHNYDYVPNN